MVPSGKDVIYRHENFMREGFDRGRKGLEMDSAIGSVIVRDGRIIASHNLRKRAKSNPSRDCSYI